MIPEAKVMGVSVAKSSSDEQIGLLVGMVEELRQEVRSLQYTVKAMQSAPQGQNLPGPTKNPKGGRRGSVAPSRAINRESR